MVYGIVRILARLAILIFFKRVFYNSRQKMPKKGPVIIAMNHPTAFLDPVVNCVMLSRPLNFLVRGDFFKKKWARTLLQSLNMIPIYRFKDGFGNLKKNHDSFEYCYRALAKGKVIAVLVEGSTIQVKRLRPLQKGAARIAFGAMDKYKLSEVTIVPAGVNFTYGDKVREEVMIELGNPISVSEYYQTYQEDGNRAITQLTKDIKDAMLKLLVHTEDPQDDELVEIGHRILRSHEHWQPIPLAIYDSPRLQNEKSVSTIVNEMSTSDKDRCKDIATDLMELLADSFITVQDTKTRLTSLSWVVGILFLPLAIAGYILRWIPFRIAKYIVKNKVKVLEFKGPIAFGAGAGYVLFPFAAISIFLFSICWCYGVGFALISITGIWYSLAFDDFVRLAKGQRLYTLLPKEKKEKIEYLISSLSKKLLTK